MHFTNPGLSILELATDPVGSGHLSVLKYLPGLGTLLDTAEYTIAFPSPDSLTEAKENHPQLGDDVEYVVFDPEKSLESQDLRNRRFDVIIAFDFGNTIEHLDVALRNDKTLLKEDGNLCMMNISSPGLYLSMLSGSRRSE